MQKFARYTAFSGAILIIIGLFWSRALLSVGCGLVFLHPFLNGNIRSTWWKFRKSSSALLLTVYYLLILISYLWTTNVNAWWDGNVILKLPMILLPFGLLSPNAFHRKHVIWLLYFFIAGAWLTGAISFGNYLLHYSEINESIIHSKPIPIFTLIGDGTEAYHIYYSLMLAFAGLAGLYLIKLTETRILRFLLVFVTICTIVFLHVIAARTGLAGFYGALLVWLLYLVFSRRKIALGLLAFATAAIAVVIAITFIPSMKNRIDNTVEDLRRYKAGEDINHFSISMRLEALKNGWRIFQRSPIIGVGPGDIAAEKDAQFERDHTILLPQNRHLPHNQFVETFVMLGIVGGIVLLLIFFWPGQFRNAEFKMLLILFISLCFVAFQFESVMERQIGLTFFVLFYILLGRGNGGE